MNKVVTMEQAMEHCFDGMTLMVGGFMAAGTAEGVVDAIVERGCKDITVICNDGGYPDRGAGKLVAAKLVKKYYASHIGLNPMVGQMMSSGEMEVVLVPQGTLAERVRAGGFGLGGILTPTGVGTEVEKSEGGKQRITMNGKDFLLEPALKADVAIVKAHRVDRMGNCIFRKSTRNFNPLIALAADYVIVEADHIEDIGCLDQDMVHLPGLFVNAIVRA